MKFIATMFLVGITLCLTLPTIGIMLAVAYAILLTTGVNMLDSLVVTVKKGPYPKKVA